MLRYVIWTSVILLAATVCYAKELGRAKVLHEGAPIMRGKRVLARVKKGRTLSVYVIKGNWYGVMPYKGWIHKKYVSFTRALGPSKAPAESVAKRLARCALIPNDAERLAAYDKVAQDLRLTGATGRDTVKQEPKQEWKKVGNFGAITTVYMSPGGLSDKHYIAQVLHTLRSETPIQQIWFFDDKSKTPTGVPMTDQQLLHWRAKYAVNRNTGYEKFMFIKTTDPTTSPPESHGEEANIRPGYAE